MELTATNKFCIALAGQKVIAKLQAAGMNEAQCREFLSRPYHLVQLLSLAEELHIAAVEIAISIQ